MFRAFVRAIIHSADARHGLSSHTDTRTILKVTTVIRVNEEFEFDRDRALEMWNVSSLHLAMIRACTNKNLCMQFIMLSTIRHRITEP